MKKGLLIVTLILLIIISFFSYREFHQLNYMGLLHIQEKNVQRHFIIYPDTTINSETFKINIKGDIKGTATISALSVYKSKKGSYDSSRIVSISLRDKIKVDTTLKVPYYGSAKGDKVIITYKPESVQQVDFIIQAGSFGLPFERILTHFL